MYKPVNHNITFADVVKSGLTLSSHGRAQPLVAVQGRSQQCELPDLVKEVAYNTCNTHLKQQNISRFVEKLVQSCPFPAAIPCFIRFAPLSDCEEIFKENSSMTGINEYVNDNVCSFAAQGTVGDQLVKPSGSYDKYDKFDNMLVKKKVDHDTFLYFYFIFQIKCKYITEK